MSISRSVGALNRYLARLLSGKFYAAAKAGRPASAKARFRRCWNSPASWKSTRRACWFRARCFEEFGFNYIGPIGRARSGRADSDAAEHPWPGRAPVPARGHAQGGRATRLAEADPVLYHGPSPFDPKMGLQKSAPGKAHLHAGVSATGCATWRRPTRGWSGSRPRCARGSGMVRFERQFPDRYFDVGIAEQHAVSFCGRTCVRGAPSRSLRSTPRSCSAPTTS